MDAVTLTSIATASMETAITEDMRKAGAIAAQFPDYSPSFTPPALIDPNYVPPDRGAVIVVTAAVFTAIMLIVVIARLLVRGYWRWRHWGWDDTWIIPAAVWLQ
jgi:hypothetical protein